MERVREEEGGVIKRYKEDRVSERASERERASEMERDGKERDKRYKKQRDTG